MRGNKMAELSLGTNDRNNPTDFKGGGRSNFVLDKGDGKAYFKAKHSRRLRNQLHTGAEAQ
jgi:hypothetical protein